MASRALAVRAQLHSHSGAGHSHVRGRPLSRRPSARRLQAWQLRSATGDEAVPASGGVPPGAGRGGSGGDGGGGGGGSGGAAGGALLAGKALESLPAEMAEALQAGKLPQEILQRFLDLDKNPFLSWLMKMGCGAWLPGWLGPPARCQWLSCGAAAACRHLQAGEVSKIQFAPGCCTPLLPLPPMRANAAPAAGRPCPLCPTCALPPPCSGFRERLLADPGFMIKVRRCGSVSPCFSAKSAPLRWCSGALPHRASAPCPRTRLHLWPRIPARPRPPSPGPQVAIEVGIGVCTKTTAEYTKRGDDFKSQLDFVFANIVM